MQGETDLFPACTVESLSGLWGNQGHSCSSSLQWSSVNEMASPTLASAVWLFCVGHTVSYPHIKTVHPIPCSCFSHKDHVSEFIPYHLFPMEISNNYSLLLYLGILPSLSEKSVTCLPNGWFQE